MKSMGCIYSIRLYALLVEHGGVRAMFALVPGGGFLDWWEGRSKGAFVWGRVAFLGNLGAGVGDGLGCIYGCECRWD